MSDYNQSVYLMDIDEDAILEQLLDIESTLELSLEDSQFNYSGNQQFDLIAYISDNDINIEELERSCIQDFDLELLDAISNDERAVEEIIYSVEEINIADIPNVEYVVVQYQDGSMTLIPAASYEEILINNAIYESDDVSQSSISSTTSSMLLDPENILNVEHSRSRGRPPNNIKKMKEELVKFGSDGKLLQRKKNNISSVVYRRKRKQTEIKLKYDLGQAIERNTLLKAKHEKNEKTLNALRTFLQSMGMAH